MGKPHTIATASFQSSADTGTAITHTEAAVSGYRHSLQYAHSSVNAPQTNNVSVTVYDGTTSDTVLSKWVIRDTQGIDTTDFPGGGIWGTAGNAMTVVMSVSDGAETHTLNTKVLTMALPDTTSDVTFQYDTASSAVISQSKAAATGVTHSLEWLRISFDDPNTTGNVTIVVRDGGSSGTVIHQQTLADDQGTKPINFEGGLWGTEGNELWWQLSAADQVTYMTSKVKSY